MSASTNQWVLLTGGAGFIGSHVAESLLKQRRNVLVVDNFDPFYSKLQKEKNLEAVRKTAKEQGASVDFLPLDIVNLKESDLKSYSLESIIHLAGKAGVRPSLKDPEAYLRVNILGTSRLLEMSRELGVQTFVMGSSSSVYGDDTPVPFSEDYPAARPISPYAASKRAAELLCSTFSQLYGIKTPVLRFFTVFGPRQRPDLAIHKFAKAISKGEPIELYGDGSTSRDYTYCSDIVDGVLAAEKWASQTTGKCYEIFNLGGSHPVSLVNLVKAIEKALGKKAEMRWLETQPGDVEKTFADISKSHRKLGYQPKVSLEDGIERFIQWLRSPEAE